MTSDVMDAGNGTYMIEGSASPIRGGASGATEVAYKDATAYCAEHQAGTHAIVVDSQNKDVYQSSFGYNQYGGGGGTFAAGRAELHFRCGN